MVDANSLQQDLVFCVCFSEMSNDFRSEFVRTPAPSQRLTAPTLTARQPCRWELWEGTEASVGDARKHRSPWHDRAKSQNPHLVGEVLTVEPLGRSAKKKKNSGTIKNRHTSV